MRDEKWLFTDWGFGLSHFKIYDSSNSFNLITERTINSGGVIHWFNIDNVKREIEEWSKINNVKLRGLKETLDGIKSEGFHYTDKGEERAIKDAYLRNKNRDKSNPFSSEIKIIK